MARDTTSRKSMPANYRRSRTKFTKEQLKMLNKVFDKSPYPLYSVKQKLAMEINIEESIIQTWFQNQRAKHQVQKNLKSKMSSESSQGKKQDEQKQMKGQISRRPTKYNLSQMQVLLKAFANDPYPGINSRKLIAEEIGVPESRVQTWFQNRRSRVHFQRKEEAESLEEEPEQGMEATIK